LRVKATTEKAEAVKLAYDGCQLAVHYIGTAVETGVTIQTTWDRPEGPLLYTLGSIQGQPGDIPAVRIMKALDNAMLGMTEGATKKVLLKPEEAYGFTDPNLVMDVPMAAAKQALGPAADTLEPDMQLQLPDGRLAKVVNVGLNAITVDLNHPLAGLDVQFEIVVLEIAEPGQLLSAQKDAKVVLARVSHILVTDLELCESLKEQIAGGADFAALAAEHSTCPSSSDGGKLGTFSAGQMVPAFDEVVFSDETEVGVVAGPVETDFGYHLILVHERVLPTDE